MSEMVPTFAVVGAVNHGKSSVVSTLAENDQVRISPMPGETVTCQRFWLRDLFAFYDTPGFQNAIEALRELEAAARVPEPLAVFRDFLSRNTGKPDFEAECRLLEPIVKEDAGIIYVVDGSEPLLEIHVAETDLSQYQGGDGISFEAQVHAFTDQGLPGRLFRGVIDDRVDSARHEVQHHVAAALERRARSDSFEQHHLEVAWEEHEARRAMRSVYELRGDWAKVENEAGGGLLGIYLKYVVDGKTPLSVTIPFHDRAGDALVGVDESGRHYVSRNVEPRVRGF